MCNNKGGYIYDVYLLMRMLFFIGAVLFGLVLFSLQFVFSADSLATFNGDFFEGFEDNNLSVNNWTLSGTGAAWHLGSFSPPGAASGTYFLMAGTTITESIIETSLDTTNYVNIAVSFNYTNDGIDAGEYLAVDFYNGTGWTNFFYNDTGYDNQWKFSNNALPISAGNNPDFKIRFRAITSNPNEDFYVDNINIRGQQLAAPTINFVAPTTQSGNYSQNVIQANVTATDGSLDTITINLYNSTGLVNLTSSSVSPLFINFINLPDGIYYLNATANNTLDNINYTETRTIIIDKFIELNLTLHNSSMATIDSLCTIINSSDDVVYNQTTTYHVETLEKGLYTMIIESVNNSFKQIKYDGLNLTGDMIELIDIEIPLVPEEFNKIYSFIPTQENDEVVENVTNLTIIFTATNNINNKILYKCQDWNWTNQNCSGSWVPIRSIVPGEDYTFFTDNLTDPGLAEGNGTFFEGFEGTEADNQANAGYDNVNWTVVGGGTWNPNSNDEFAGAKALSAKGNTGGFAWNEINISTEGYSGVIFSVYYKTSGSFEGGNYQTIEWYNGTNWIAEVNTSNVATYTLFNQTLTSDASNNSNFRIRLGCNVDETNEYCLWDNVQITAIAEDTCIYSGSGNWNVLCSDNCLISSNVNVFGNNISITGFGSFRTTVNISNFANLYIAGDSSVNHCEVYCQNGGCFV